jgi:hypothetical protein
VNGRRHPGAVAILGAALAASGCLPYGTFQSARLEERGKPRAVFMASSVRLPWAHPDDPNAVLVEAMGRFRTGERTELGIRPSLLFADDGTGASLGLDAKTAVVADWFAFDCGVNIPFFYFPAVQLIPGAILSLPAGRHAEIDLSGKVFLYRGMENVLYTLNVGLALFGNRAGMRLRPEVGWVHGGVYEDDFLHFGLGVDLAVRSDKEGQEGGGRRGAWQ